MMSSTYRAKVVGVTASKGTFKDDDGNMVEYDSTKIYVELDLRGETARGVATQVYKIGKSTMYDEHKLASIPLPFMAELDIRKTTNGREEREEIYGFRVVKPEPMPKAA